MPLRNFIILIVWILSVLGNIEIGFSQTREMDSLKFVLTNSIEDSNRVNTLHKLGEKFWERYDFPNTHKYTDAALALAKKIKYVPGEFNALMCLGNINAAKSNKPEANKYFSAAIELTKRTGDKKKIAETYNWIASCYKYALIYSEAFKNAFIALKLFEEIGNKYNIAQTWLMIGRIYSYQNDFPEVENCCKKALKLFEESAETQQDDIAVCYQYIGRANLFMGNYTRAMEMLSAALTIWEKAGDIASINGANYNIAQLYKRLGEKASANGDKKTAEKMYNECRKKFINYLPLPEYDKDFLYVAESNQELGDINILLKRYPEARTNLKKALEFTAKTGMVDTYRDIYGSLSRLDSAEGKYKQAFEHYKLFVLYRDSIINQERTKKTEEYKLQYEFDKKEDSLKQKQLITETKLFEQKKQKYFYWVGLTMLALLSFFVFLNFRNQKKLNRLAKENFAKERSELELLTLRTQLNPHFIFNCISSIDGLIQNNEKYNATNYLNKFAKLMRSVLENSKENTVKFSNDIETLKLYLDLEQLRNEDKYITELTISNELLNTDYIVPPLIIQPFVENAIQHGLKNKPGKTGILKINIRRVEDHLEYIIADNGIGRQATEKDKLHDHKSYGVNMSMDRIRLFNNEEIASVKIEDETDKGIAMGTTVTVKLKLK